MPLYVGTKIVIQVDFWLILELYVFIEDLFGFAHLFSDLCQFYGFVMSYIRRRNSLLILTLEFLVERLRNFKFMKA